jgi:hypothetical protein
MATLTRTLFAVAVLTLAACSSAASSTVPPAATSQPSAAPGAPASGGQVTTPDEAAQLVIALDPRFAGIEAKDPKLIGGCCFYEATQTADGFEVVVEIGSGDCPSGCIDRHRWTYAVTPDGTTRLLSETGDPVPSASGGGKGDY